MKTRHAPAADESANARCLPPRRPAARRPGPVAPRQSQIHTGRLSHEGATEGVVEDLRKMFFFVARLRARRRPRAGRSATRRPSRAAAAARPAACAGRRRAATASTAAAKQQQMTTVAAIAKIRSSTSLRVLLSSPSSASMQPTQSL